MKKKKKFVRQKYIIVSILVAILFLIVIFAPEIVPYDPYEQNLSMALSPPSREYLLGTDRYGRDIASRVIMGARTSVCSALILVLFNTTFGSFIGMLCGYYGGKLDSILMRISDIFLAFPGVVFAIAVAAVMGGGIVNSMIALGCISWPKFARIARSQVLRLKKETFIEAAKLSGCTSVTILFRHILPNSFGILFVTATLDIGTMMMEMAGLSFLGLGALPPTAEWGSMMSNGRSMIQTSPWVVLAPGTAMFLTVALFHLLGDMLRDRLDKK